MEIVIILVTVINSIAIALGVGSSTIAIVNFFVAISDGTISPEERALMGVVYHVLRIAMVLILLTTLILGSYHSLQHGFADYLTPFKLALWTLVGVLYLNAFLMTKHLISSSFGPAIQASTWYSLGILTPLMMMNLHNFAYWQFLLAYAVFVTFAVVLVNSIILKVSPSKK